MFKFKKPKKALTKNILKILWLVYAIISMLYWIPSVNNMLAKDYDSTSQHISLDDNWDITINGTSYKNISLNDFNSTVRKGDKIIMQKTLPDNFGENDSALRLHIRQTTVNIYIDGEKIYEYGVDRAESNKTVGSGFQFIKFPKEYEGKQMRIDLLVTEDEAFKRFDSIRIYEWDNAYKSLMTENRFPLFFGSFLVIFGVISLIITSFAVVFSTKYIKMFCISAFSICVGLWTLCYYNTFLIFSIPLYSISLIEYMALYLAPLPLIIYMYENVKSLKNKSLKVTYWILLIVQILFDVVILGLHTMDILHCAAVLKYLQMLIICHLIYFTMILIKNLKFKTIKNKLYLVGMLVIICCVGYDMFNYYFQRYYGNSFLSIQGASAISVFIFVIILIVAFYMDITKKLMAKSEQDLLIKVSYTDEPTQLNNRRYCSEYMKKLNEQSEINCTIFSFDLNNLKVTNDTYGHTRGDILIKSAADVISETFKGGVANGVVGRMGGDEFIAILSTSDENEVNRLKEEFASNIDKKNKTSQIDLNLSISYGYALSSELQEVNIEKLYHLADEKMYEYKKNYKAGINKAN